MVLFFQPVTSLYPHLIIENIQKKHNHLFIGLYIFFDTNGMQEHDAAGGVLVLAVNKLDCADLPGE